MKKKCLAWLLALIQCLGLLGLPAYAAEEEFIVLEEEVFVIEEEAIIEEILEEPVYELEDETGSAPQEGELLVFEMVACEAAVKPGDSITVDIGILENPGFSDLNMILEYDQGALVYDSGFCYENTALTWDLTDSLAGYAITNSTCTGPILSLDFTVSEAAEPGDYSIGFTADIMDENQTVVAYDVIPAAITVKASAETYPFSLTLKAGEEPVKIAYEGEDETGCAMHESIVHNATVMLPAGTESVAAESTENLVNVYTSHEDETQYTQLAFGQSETVDIRDVESLCILDTANSVAYHVAVAFAPCGHSWNEATCSAPKTCAICGEMEGEVASDCHHYVDGKCEYCGKSDVSGYFFATSADVTAEIGGQAVVQLNIIGHSDEKVTTYNAYTAKLTFDSDKLELLDYDGAVKADNGSVSVDGDEICIAGCGAAKNYSDALAVLSFRTKAEGTAEVNVSGVFVSDKEEAVREDAPGAFAKQEEYNLTADATPDKSFIVVPFTVIKPGFISGNDKVLEGTDYTFSYTDTDNYTYSDLSVTVGGEMAVPAEAEGVFTVSNITGAVEITATQTANVYEVTKPECVDGPDQAVYGEDYVFSLMSDAGLPDQTIAVVLDDGTPVVYTHDPGTGTYTVSGVTISGAFTITVGQPENSEMTCIQFEGITSSEIEGGQLSISAASGKDFPFQLIRNPEDDIYTVKVGETELTGDGEGRYTIPASLIGRDPVTVTVTRIPAEKLAVDVTEYFRVDGETMFLVTARWGSRILAYGEEGMMFYSDRYSVASEQYSNEQGAYCWLVLSADGMSTADTVKAAAEAAIVEASEGMSATKIAYDCDVNRTTVADINDAQLVYDMYNASFGEFTEELPMRKFLEADVETDKILETKDVVAIINVIVSVAAAT